MAFLAAALPAITKALPAIGKIGAAVLPGLFNMKSTERQNRLNREFQAQENEKARAFQQNMWLLNNAYNDPTAQMQRLKMAGINPHLAYSNGGVMNTAQQASSNASATVPGIAPQFDIGAMLATFRTFAEIDNIKADTKQKEAQTQGQLTLNGITAKDLDNYDQRFNVEQAFKQSATSLNYSNVQFNDKKIELTDAQIQETYAEIKNKATTNELLNKQIDLLVTQKNYTLQQIQNLLVNMAVGKATIDNLRSQSLLNIENAKTQSYIRSKMHAETLNLQETYKMLNRQNYIGNKYDLSNAEYQFRYNSKQYDKLIQEIYNIQKQNGLMDKQIDLLDFQNSMNYILAPAQIIDSYKSAVIPFKSVTNTFNSSGKPIWSQTTYRNK